MRSIFHRSSVKMRDEPNLSRIGRLVGNKSILSLTTAPTYRRLARAFVDADKYIYIGGKDNTTYYRDARAYDIVNNSWSTLTEYPGVGTYGCSWGQDYAGNLYLGGGHFGGSSAKDFWKFNIAANQWTQMTDIPIPSGVHSASCCSVGAYIYHICGLIGGVGSSGVYRYHMPSDTWESVSGSTYAMSGTSAMYWNDNIYIWSGNRTGVGYVAIILKYAILTNSWSVLEAVPPGVPGRIYAVSWAFNGKLYLLGGVTALRDMWEYDLITRVFARLQDWQFVQPPTYAIWAFDYQRQNVIVQAGGESTSYEIARI